MDESMVQERQQNSVEEMRGVDADPARRPGVPMQTDPRPAPGARWSEPSRQANADDHLHRAGIDRPTPIVGTAQPPRGLSGALRRSAYQIPEHYARHWLMLLIADRVDVLEHRLGELMEQPLRNAGMERQADRVAAHPLATVAGVLVGAWILKKAI